MAWGDLMKATAIYFSTIPQKTINILTSPTDFFRKMPKMGGYIEPLIFVVVMGVIGSLIQAVAYFLGLKIPIAISLGLPFIIIFPLIMAISGFIGAAILFVIWKLLGSVQSYETAYSCVAYTSALSLITHPLSFIPFIGYLISTILTTIFLVVASVEVHNIPSKKAWLVFGIIGATQIIINIIRQIIYYKITFN